MNFAKIVGKVFEHWKITTAAAVVLAGVLGGILAFFTTPKPKSDKPEDIAKFAASSKFDRLTNKQKEEYLRQLRPRPGERRDRRNNPMRSMSEQERRALFRQMGAMRQRQMLKEYRAYMKMNQAEKNAFLDAKIAEQDKRMAEWAKRRAEREARRAQNGQNGQNRNGQNGQQRPRPTAEQRAAFMKSRIESESPEVRSARQKMMQDMMKRRRETGKTMQRPQGGGRGGRGGGQGGRR